MIIGLIALGVASVTDVKLNKIPLWITLPLIILGIGSFWFIPRTIPEIIAEIIFCAVFFFIPSKIIGGGDRMLMLGVCLLTGAKSAAFTFIVGNILAGVLVVIKQKAFLPQKNTICMAPFFAGAFCLMLLLWRIWDVQIFL